MLGFKRVLPLREGVFLRTGKTRDEENPKHRTPQAASRPQELFSCCMGPAHKFYQQHSNPTFYLSLHPVFLNLGPYNSIIHPKYILATTDSTGMLLLNGRSPTLLWLETMSLLPLCYTHHITPTPPPSTSRQGLSIGFLRDSPEIIAAPYICTILKIAQL